MDNGDFMNALRGFTLGAILVVGATLAVFGFIKLGSNLFDTHPSNSEQSIKICKEKGGTPVLEGYGEAYKSCAINGKSDTKNVVK